MIRMFEGAAINRLNMRALTGENTNILPENVIKRTSIQKGQMLSND